MAHSPPSSTSPSGEPPLPALWHEPPPQQFGLRAPLWAKFLVFAVAAVLAMLFVDQPLAVWARAHPIPDMSRGGEKYSGGDIARELMLLEQWGQAVCSMVVITAVALLDKAGRRRALALTIGCVLTLLLTHFLKEVFSRTRPFSLADLQDGSWRWGGPLHRLRGGTRWASFPSAHTTAAFALSAGLSWFYPRGRALFMTLAVITAGQRILHTAHYLSDTLAGLVIGVTVMRWSLGAKLAGRLIALGPPGAQRWWHKER